MILCDHFLQGCEILIYHGGHLAAVLNLLNSRGSGKKFLGLRPELENKYLKCQNLALFQICDLYPSGEHLRDMPDEYLNQMTIIKPAILHIFFFSACDTCLS